MPATLELPAPAVVTFTPPDTKTLNGVEYEYMALVPVVKGEWRGPCYHVYHSDASDIVPDVVLLDESGAEVRYCDPVRFKEIRGDVELWLAREAEARDLAAKESAEERRREARAVDAFSPWWRSGE